MGGARRDERHTPGVVLFWWRADGFTNTRSGDRNGLELVGDVEQIMILPKQFRMSKFFT